MDFVAEGRDGDRWDSSGMNDDPPDAPQAGQPGFSLPVSDELRRHIEKRNRGLS